MKKVRPYLIEIFIDIVRYAHITDYCLIGGRAVEFYVNPPQTPDVDILIHPRAFKKVLAGLKASGYKLRENILVSGMVFMKKEIAGKEVEIDLFEAVGEYEQRVLKNALSRHDIAIIPIAMPEDIIVMKIIAIFDRQMNDKAKTLRDMEAIEHILESVNTDTVYIRSTLIDYDNDGPHYANFFNHFFIKKGQK